MNDPAETVSDSRPSSGPETGYQVLLVLAVIVAYGPIVLVNQIFWDDWVVLAYAKLGTLWDLYKEMGGREIYPVVKPFVTVADPRFWTTTELLLFCALAPLIHTIIRRVTNWPAQDAFWAALLTALVPLNQARFALTTVTYAFSCVLFALSIVLLLRDLNASSIGRRILVVALLMMSFTTQSFLVLAWFAPMVVAIDAWRKAEPASWRKQAGAAARGVLSRGELLLAPPLYWLGKRILQPTSGLYAEYNKFQLDLPSAIKETLVAVAGQFSGARLLLPSASDLPQLAIVVALAIALFAAVARIWRLPLGRVEDTASRSRRIADVLALVVAAVLVFSALFPYVFVGKPPRFNGLWETRHQTTLMMASGFVIWAVLRLVVSRRSLPRLAAILAAGFLLIDISVTHRLVADGLELRALSNYFKANPAPPGTMMLVVENDRDYRTLGRFLPFYELAYLINADRPGNPTLPQSNREILDPSTKTYAAKATVPAVIATLRGLCEKYRSTPQYGFGGFVSNGQIETVRLVTNRPPPGLIQAIGLAVRSSSASGASQELAALVRVEREIAPIGGTCVAPCCKDQ
jgi:hypothetical protein